MAEIKIYTRSFCGYCVAAKRLLAGKGAAFEEIDCTGDDETRRWLVETTGQRTVPQIFIDGVPVGGFQDLAALDGDGALDEILAGTRAPDRI